MNALIALYVSCAIFTGVFWLLILKPFELLC